MRLTNPELLAYNHQAGQPELARNFVLKQYYHLWWTRYNQMCHLMNYQRHQYQLKEYYNLVNP